jgi:hypothetical protein
MAEKDPNQDESEEVPQTENRHIFDISYDEDPTCGIGCPGDSSEEGIGVVRGI